MELKIFQTNQAFLDHCKEFLNRYPERTQLFVINIGNDLSKQLLRNECRGAVFSQGEPILVFLNPPMHNLQLFSLEYHEEALDLLVEFLIEHMIEIKGVQGNKKNTDHFIKTYTFHTHLKFKLRLSMNIMRLDELKQVPLKGNYRMAELKDLTQLVPMEMAFYEEAVHESLKNCEIYEKLRNQLDKKQIVVLADDDDQILSIAMASRTMHKGRAVSLVYTLKKYRNMGYSQSLMYQLCESLFKQGYEFVSLFVDKTNPVSNRLYLKLGFQVSEDNYDYIIDKESI